MSEIPDTFFVPPPGGCPVCRERGYIEVAPEPNAKPPSSFEALLYRIEWCPMGCLPPGGGSLTDRELLLMWEKEHN